MKKTERVTLIMRYINNRAHFTISEIQREFGISRATAIRDVQEIEAMGLPLVSEKGRAGGYSVLPNEFLPAVRFTPDELRAIFISFNASKNSQLPFLQSRKTISEKLLAIAPQTQQDSLLALDQLLLFESTNPANPSLLELDDNAPAELNQLITLALSDRHLQVTYERSPGWPQLMDVWVLHILSESGSWLLEIYDFSDDTFKFLPIAQLRHSVSADSVPLLSEKEIAAKKRSQSRGANLIVRLETDAIQRFKHMHPPGIVLNFTGMFQTEAVFSTTIDTKNSAELDYYTHFLLYLGDSVSYDKLPPELTALLQTKLTAIKKKL